MPVVIGASALWRKLTTTYGGQEVRSGAHPTIIFEIEGQIPIHVTMQHGNWGDDLPDFIASQIKRSLGLKNMRELKEVERCSFGAVELRERLIRVT